MNTEKKKKLLADVRRACTALGQILDGGHDFTRLRSFPASSVAILLDGTHTALAGLATLETRLTAEIGTDNL
jgi:hypothetical protein